MTGRWWAVGTTGVVCGALVGWLLHALTGAWVAGVVVGGAVASILLVLAVAGAGYNERAAAGEERLADARARRARVQDAMRATRRDARGGER
jgi:hypothetical protein